MYNENIKKALRKYLRKVKKKLKIIYSTVKTKDILQKPERDAYSFFEENPQASFTDFEKEFGTPNEILDEFIDFNQVDKIIRRVIFSLWVKRVILCIIILGLSVMTVFCICMYKGYKESINAVIVREVTVIE